MEWNKYTKNVYKYNIKIKITIIMGLKIVCHM